MVKFSVYLNRHVFVMVETERWFILRCIVLPYFLPIKLGNGTYKLRFLGRYMYYASSVYQDETAYSVPSQQDLHCLPF